jgi:hypothetical protein
VYTTIYTCLTFQSILTRPSKCVDRGRPNFSLSFFQLSSRLVSPSPQERLSSSPPSALP